MGLKTSAFTYIRHGQTDWNLQSRPMGQQDIPLNPTGIQQAIDARKSLKDIRVICHSPLLRAKKTAEILNEELNCPMFCIDNLKEFYLGKYQGQPKEQWFKDWKEGKLTEDVEPYEDFLHRALSGINESLSISENVLIVAHGGVYWAVEHFAKLEKTSLPNCKPALHLPPTDTHSHWRREFVS